MRISQPHSRLSTIPSIPSPTYSNTSPIMVSVLTTRGSLLTTQTFPPHRPASATPEPPHHVAFLTMPYSPFLLHAVLSTARMLPPTPHTTPHQLTATLPPSW
uniref:Uncharacterized protein n=1 Tax=Bartonella schoenbuchensis (strain DSM 13525 / NCTC 13165 / R1) TaxID=687861 RepID=E6Z1B3_BARSR|nr:hypothetical protein BARSC_190174 [Bartonella schoenbuchensis R1]